MAGSSAGSYKDLAVAIDNSECSGRAVEVAIELARRTGAKLTGIHVYAVRLHGARFRQMEPGLPERYQQDEFLQRQRGIHADLIGRGLGIISDSYLDQLEEKCRSAAVPFARRALEGRNYCELVRDARESGYDLMVIGAHGLGRVDRTTLGSVCERVSRLVECDVLVVRGSTIPGPSPILVAIDGSPHSFAALSAGIELSRLFDSGLYAVAAYDPFFHSAAFRGIAEVLSAEAARLFRFQEQERLHDEIIDAGLMAVYRSHLEEAQGIAEKQGVPLGIEVLEGKPFDSIASHVQKLRPALLVVGRVGIHHESGVSLGSTAENLLRCVSCNVLIVNRGVADRPDSRQQEEQASTGQPPRWSVEAEQRLQRVPPFVRAMVRKRIEQLARTQGLALVTPDLFDQVRNPFGKG